MINLNMQDTNSFQQVLKQFTASKETEAADSVNFVPETHEDVKKEFLLGVIARDLTSNPDIKPIVSLFILIGAFFSSTIYCQRNLQAVNRILIQP